MTKLPKYWSPNAKKIYLEVFSIMKSQKNISHPKMPKMTKEHWETIRHNAAWLAASAYDGR